MKLISICIGLTCIVTLAPLLANNNTFPEFIYDFNENPPYSEASCNENYCYSQANFDDTVCYLETPQTGNLFDIYLNEYNEVAQYTALTLNDKMQCFIDKKGEPLDYRKLEAVELLERAGEVQPNINISSIKKLKFYTFDCENPYDNFEFSINNSPYIHISCQFTTKSSLSNNNSLNSIISFGIAAIEHGSFHSLEDISRPVRNKIGDFKFVIIAGVGVWFSQSLEKTFPQNYYTHYAAEIFEHLGFALILGKIFKPFKPPFGNVPYKGPLPLVIVRTLGNIPYYTLLYLSLYAGKQAQNYYFSED